MNWDPRHHNNIFLLPIGDYLQEETEAYHLIYAPLLGRTLLADKEGLDQWPKFFPDSEKHRLPDKVDSARELTKMAVLPNHTCNFNCSYCYSAQGRSDVILDKDILEKALTYFIDPHRLKERTLNLTFIGGGEPLLSWPLVKYGIEYAHRLATFHGFSLQTTLTSNGSIISEDIIHTLKQYGVIPNISFDILEEAQNKHRKHFKQVCHTLELLCQDKLFPVVIATITPDSVERLEEMFDFIDERFPEITAMSFEPVISNEVFSTANSLEAFYNSFIVHFFRARTKAKSKGKSVSCRIFRNVNSIMERGCPSKLTLTPQGDLTICYCVSSPQEKFFAKRVFGKVGPDGVTINEERFQQINGINVHSFAKCENCFAKWHCAGGCMCANDRYDEDHLNEVCKYTKEMVRRTLFERIKEKSRHDGKWPLKDYCQSVHIIEL